MDDAARLNRAAKLLLLVGLVALVLLRGVAPAFRAITDDFPPYFTSATIVVRDGRDTGKLYDGTWFREQTRRYHVGNQVISGEFTPYPPPTALLLVPLTGLEPLTALRVVTVLNVLWVMCSMVLLTRIFAWRLLDSALFVLASGWGLYTGLRFGHPYIVISTFCLLGYQLYLKRRPWLAGLCLGVFVPIKYYPVIVLASFALYRQWRVVLGGGLAIAVVVMISIGVLGWQVHQTFLQDVILNHFTGQLIQGPRFLANFQSFDTLFDRLFIFDSVRNPHPVLDAAPMRTIAVLGTKGVLLLAAVAALIKLARGTEAVRAIAPTIGLLGVLVLLVAPGTTTYHFVLLWLPIALLTDYFLSKGDRLPAYLILGLYALIGFIPYSHTYPFDGRGVLTVLAFPRLFLVLAMYVVCVWAVLLPRRSGERLHLEMQNV
ncbi:MAG TPA: glycosyltransferase family 87 protein [Steroidobacteraceae bacterium]|jgi:hypothetical protein